MGEADGVVFCFNRREGLQDLERWIVDARESAKPGFVGTIVDTTPIEVYVRCGESGGMARELAES
jgi:hypothetical protein